MAPTARFAATALTQGWGEDGPLLFLGPWCLTERNEKERAQRECRMLATPWSEPGAEAAAFAEYDRLETLLLMQLAERLGRKHGLKRSFHWWRIVLGPWLMAWLTTLQDRLMTAKKALAEAPQGSFVFPDVPPPLARDSGEYMRWLSTDAFNQHVYAAAFRLLGAKGTEASFPAPQVLRDNAAWRGPKGRALSLAHRLSRFVLRPPVIYSSLYMSREQQSRLALRTFLRAQPLLTLLPDPPETRDAWRDRRPEPVDGSKLARLAAETVNEHLPRLFLEGWPAAFARLTREWKRAPKVALTSVGWCLDEAFKLLAAETVERGGRLAIAQHGGAYGLFDVLYNERHERAVAHEWWSWGWRENESSALPARVMPMPNPRLAPRSPAPAREGWLLVTHALPRCSYTFYYCNVPLWPRYDEYLSQRDAFARALPPAARQALSVRLPMDDNGWGMKARLERAAPGLRCEEPGEPLLQRAGRARLTVVDHPQTSALELLAADFPTLLFWDPELWRMRPQAQQALGALRRAGVLHDGPESAAKAVAEALRDPEAWWSEPSRRLAVESFRDRYARGSAEWTGRWAERLRALVKEASA